ncbi:hypothetical protein TDB9533_01080 [Thalassocella blandensis]|nr:hypothetical protein TDB9533_01080 [Thalassocella blandensis]
MQRTLVFAAQFIQAQFVKTPFRLANILTIYLNLKKNVKARFESNTTFSRSIYRQQNSPLLKWLVLVITGVGLAGCKLPGEFPKQDEICTFDAARESLRQESAQNFATPVIEAMYVNNSLVWEKEGQQTTPTLKPGDMVTLTGQNFGNGTDIDFSKIMIGNSRVLETDLKMYKQILAISDEVNYETSELHDTWDKDVIVWAPYEISFRVPVHVHNGPLRVQIQKREGFNESLTKPGEAHLVIDAQRFRVIDEDFEYPCDVVSKLSEPVSTDPIDVIVDNPEYEDLVQRGRMAFWSYDYNIGVAHSFRNLDWDKIFDGSAVDPITGEFADPLKLFGAHKVVPGQVPFESYSPVYFDSYPQPNPIPGFLTKDPQLLKGNTWTSGYVGYRYAQSSHPLIGRGAWIGFNCSSCHGYKITYENVPNNIITRVFPGPPNPLWSLKWTLLDNFTGVEEKEEGPAWDPAAKDVDKSMLVYNVPQGMGEHTMVRIRGEGSLTDNDYEFSPIAIPNVTNHMPIRRSLSHTESYVGFEGSYIHAEEPDGAVGSMRADWLQALTAYMTQLDKYDDDLRRVGMYRWMKDYGLLEDMTGTALSEGQFVQAGWEAYPALMDTIADGKQQFNNDCGSCHTDGLGAHTNERMIRLNEVGRFFEPTIYHKEVQSIRATFIRNIYWVQHRGLLSDGHVRNLVDLVDPDRCDVNSQMYQDYYTLHPPVNPALGGSDHPEPYPAYNRKGDVFRVPKSDSQNANDTGAKRNRFIERHKYFVEVPWDPDYYYWDYQQMRLAWGPDEIGSEEPVGFPASPHPWCASNRTSMNAMILYMLTM